MIAGKIVRMTVGCVVIAVDLVTYLHEQFIAHVAQTGWQILKDHAPYLVLGYLLVDWRHAFGILKQLKDKIPGVKP